MVLLLEVPTVTPFPLKALKFCGGGVLVTVDKLIGTSGNPVLFILINPFLFFYINNNDIKIHKQYHIKFQNLY